MLSSASLVVGTEHKIEPRLPCLATIHRSHRSLADASIHGLPCAANKGVPRMIDAASDHFTIPECALNNE